MTETQYGKDLTTDCHQVHIIPLYLKPNLLELNRTMSTTTQRQACALAHMCTHATLERTPTPTPDAENHNFYHIKQIS